MMNPNNTIFLFQAFSDSEPLDHNSIKDGQKEWATYFIEMRSKCSY